MTDYILTTCKNRLAHLSQSLPSWRMFLPKWVPVIVTVDDPQAENFARLSMGERPWLSVTDTHRGFSRLVHLRKAVDALPDDANRVVILDADIVALLGTDRALSAPFEGFCVADCLRTVAIPHDAGVLWASADVLRAAWDLLGNCIDDWEGYGWEDMLIRAACWLVTGGKINKRPIVWAHIPHADSERVASYDDRTVNEQAQANYARFLRDVRLICARRGVAAAHEKMLSEILIWPSRRPNHAGI